MSIKQVLLLGDDEIDYYEFISELTGSSYYVDHTHIQDIIRGDASVFDIIDEEDVDFPDFFSAVLAESMDAR